MAEIGRLEKNAMMSQAVIHNGVVYLSGQIAWDTRSEGVAAQTREVLGAIDRLLGLAGTEKSRLLTVTIWLADIGDFSNMNEIWLEWIDKENPPARATVESVLAFPDLKIEIQAMAAIGKS